MVATKAMNEVWLTIGAAYHTASQIPEYRPGLAIAAAINKYPGERRLFLAFSSIDAPAGRCEFNKSFDRTVIPTKAPVTRRSTDSIDRLVCRDPLMDFVIPPPKNETRA